MRNRRQRRKKRYKGKCPEGSTLVWCLDPWWVKRMSNETITRGPCVYAISLGKKWVKIGHAANVWQRLAALQTANPESLEVLLVIRCNKHVVNTAVESVLHQALARHRVKGEWFDRDGAGVQRLLRGPEYLPFKVIEAMIRHGVRASPEFPKHVTHIMEEQRVETARQALGEK